MWLLTLKFNPPTPPPQKKKKKPMKEIRNSIFFLKKYKQYVVPRRKETLDFSMLLQPLLNGRTKSMVGDKITVFKLHICHW